ncbi:hypothetical protein FA95DRAFT_1577620 [Auriscalpium vulgare]|uniref:Uncharacterized protein n=1 Tax=Auriscalpium vulgare TaxID=40419 RepID=A0ACB8R653_9AGAM|nr:hypothetical protein FA95DRAFT_1577620 [Auriscalpium vulgare]
MVTSNTSSAPTRTFPPSIPLNPDFPRLYVRFKVPTANPRGKGTPNAPRSPLDLYTPRLTQGSGRGKVGLCPLCPRSPRTWFSMKFSAFKYYHMQYFHGISPAAALPFSPPTAFRTVPRPHATKLERNTMREGKCHRCGKWTPVEGVKNMETKVPELYWWKHAAACHGTSHIPGERDVFIEDAAYVRALEETKPDDQTESEED